MIAVGVVIASLCELFTADTTEAVEHDGIESTWDGWEIFWNAVVGGAWPRSEGRFGVSNKVVRCCAINACCCCCCELMACLCCCWDNIVFTELESSFD